VQAGKFPADVVHDARALLFRDAGPCGHGHDLVAPEFFPVQYRTAHRLAHEFPVGESDLFRCFDFCARRAVVFRRSQIGIDVDLAISRSSATLFSS
jgi:hypothetical protein